MKCRKTYRIHLLGRDGDSCNSFLQRAHRSQRGVALVLTLIMLAIITVVTVVFLATARRNRQTTTLTKDRTDAEFAGDTAYQRATAEIIARILRDTNLLSFGFLVSQPRADVAPVEYLSGLPVHPLIPVVTNASETVGSFLDLNRNRFFDPGLLVTNNLGQTNIIPSGYRLGDPVWIGILNKPWLPHAPNNHFVSRMAYVVVPTGDILDINNIHNTNNIAGGGGAGYLRNQGFGPWEMNLAAFLADLAPNVWWNDGAPQYQYGPFPKPIARGLAFEDAFSFVNYRRGFRSLWPSLADNFSWIPPESLDVYSDGGHGGAGIVLGADPFIPGDDSSLGKVAMPWNGSDSTNHFFDIQQFFDQKIFNPLNQAGPHFPERLSQIISNDPSAYYRLVSQIGTDAGSDFRDRINLNYADEHAGYSVTNFQSWDDPAKPELAVAFFTNVAQRIFLAQSNEFNNLSTNALPIRSITEIPVYPTNLYSTAIHRILQEAANIFDATRSNIYPSVFRPIFGRGPMSGVNYIVGYTNDDRVSTLRAWIDTNTNGIPLVIGAKKGYPNFNEFTLRTDFLVSRKLQLTRPDAAARPNGTNQMYVLGISNYFGAESWNSYDVQRGARPYPRNLRISVSNYTTMWLSNGLGFQTNAVLTVANATNISGGQWTGGEAARAFLLPLNTNQVFLSNAVYVFNGNVFANISTNSFESFGGFLLPYWIYTISNRVSYVMSEPSGPNTPYERVVDFVLLNDNQTVDLYRDLLSGIDPYQNTGASTALSTLWRTNRNFGINGPTEGILRQLAISLGNVATGNADWRSYALATTARESDKNNAIDMFRSFCGLGPLYGTVGTNSLLEMQAPFNPAARLAVLSTWQANDPLVHYHVADLRIGGSPTNHQVFFKPSMPGTNVAPSSLGFLNKTYSPWGGNPQSSADPVPYDRSVKDPGVYGSDDWAFPTNKFASIGLLGRVHRGTPWQTIYFKSEAAPAIGGTGWTNLSADIAQRPNGQIFSRTHPTNDWKLPDMFTTALDERTSRGLMSVNQQGVESWSALLSGVVVLSNSTAKPVLKDPRQYTELIVEPWGNVPLANSPLGIIWSNIHKFQTNFAVPLQHVGDILQVPELTVRSPFLNVENASNPQQPQRNWGIDDFAYEQIPQQILSLLRVGPARFVIYAYGQALKPAAINPANGLVSNYQVTAEYATRTVVRVEGDPRGRVRTVVESFNILPPD